MGKKRIVLGVDASTSCLGTSVVSYDGENIEVLYVHYVKMKQSKKYKGTDSLFYKSKQFKNEFIDKIKGWGITDIVIEEPLPNSQNVITVNSLMKFNGMISQSLYESLGVIPEYISSYDARKYAFPELMAVRKFNKSGEEYSIKNIKHALKHSELVLFGAYPFDVQKKFILWNKIAELYPRINWAYDKENNLTVENFDASDSLVCILGYLKKEKYEKDEPVVTKFDITQGKVDNELYNISYTMRFCGKTFDKKISLTKNNDKDLL